MLRLFAVPFALLLLVVSFGLVAAGVALLAEAADDRGQQGRGPILDLGMSSDNDPDHGLFAIAGASLVGFGVLGAIAAVALLIVALAGGRKQEAGGPGQQQQQQQQVVVVTHPGGAGAEERP